MVSLCWFTEFETYENDGSIKNFLVDKVSYSKEKVIEYLKKGTKQASCPRPIKDPVTKKIIADYFSAYTDGEYYWVNILPELIDKYYQSIKEGWWEEFCSDIYFYGSDAALYKDCLMRIPKRPEYSYHISCGLHGMMALIFPKPTTALTGADAYIIT